MKKALIIIMLIILVGCASAPCPVCPADLSGMLKDCEGTNDRLEEALEDCMAKAQDADAAAENCTRALNSSLRKAGR